MKSEAATPAAYIASLPADRRTAMTEVRRVVRARVPKGLAEVMSFGMIAWVVPLATYPDTYNGQPLMYAALASQKNYMSLYLMCIYSGGDREATFRARWRGGKKLNMGKSCVRFGAADDLDLPLIGESLEAHTVESFVALARSVRRGR